MSQTTHDYSNFDTREYMAKSYADNSPKKKLMEYLYEDLLSNVKMGGSFLDMGAGPSVCLALVASRVYDDITLAEYAKPNREELEKWVRNDTDAYDWSKMANLVAGFEGSDKDTVISRTRKAVNHIIPCDLKEDNPLFENSNKKYDCITTLTTVECAAHDIPSYKRVLEKIYDLVKPGGKLIMLGTSNTSFYAVNDVKYYVFKISIPEVISIVKEMCPGQEVKVKTVSAATHGLQVDADEFFYIGVTKPLE